MSGSTADPATIAPESPGGFDRSDLDRLPASHGVIAFDDADGRAMRFLATADARSCAGTRLIPSEEAPDRSAELAGITARVRFWPCSCALEADLLHARLGPSVLAGGWDAIRRTLGFHALHADPVEAHPRFRPRESADLPDGTLIGPFTTRKRADRFAEGLVDLYELCRKYERLVEAPHAPSCVYKELGTCPAACDGSETMDAYRARFARALELAREPADRSIERAAGRMSSAADALDFERAERERSALARIESLRAPPNHLACDLRSAPWLAVSTARRKRRIYAAIIRGGRVLAERTLTHDVTAAAAQAFARALDAPPEGSIDADVIGVLLARFARPKKKDPARLFVLADGGAEEIGGKIASFV